MAVAMAAPEIPMAGKPRWPKISTQLRLVLTTKLVALTNTAMVTLPTERNIQAVLVVMA